MYEGTTYDKLPPQCLSLFWLPKSRSNDVHQGSSPHGDGVKRDHSNLGGCSCTQGLNNFHGDYEIRGDTGDVVGSTRSPNLGMPTQK